VIPPVPTVLDPENLERLEQGAACRIGPLGALADRLAVRRRLVQLLRDRNAEIRRTAAHPVS